MWGKGVGTMRGWLEWLNGRWYVVKVVEEIMEIDALILETVSHSIYHKDRLGNGLGGTQAGALGGRERVPHATPRAVEV